MTIFGWSLPPGCGNLPGEEDEQPVQLHEDSTLIGYGRRQHGLYGKDADLDAGGQLRIKSVWWFEDRIEVEAQGYASLVPADESDDERFDDAGVYDAYMDYCTEVIVGEHYPGEWDGDYWVLTNDIKLTIPCELEEGQRDEALRLVYAKVTEANANFERAMASLSKAMEADTYFQGEQI